MFKSTLIALATVATVTAASASGLSGTSVGLSYDYGRANGAAQVRNLQEATVTVAKTTSVGTFDVAAQVRQADARGFGSDASQGFEVGYGLKGELHGLGLQGRIGYGQINGITNRRIGEVTGFRGNGEYAVASIEAGLPAQGPVKGFLGYRFRHALESTVANQSRVYAGAEFGLTPSIGLRAAFTHDRQVGQIYNGVSTSVNYKF